MVKPKKLNRSVTIFLETAQLSLLINQSEDLGSTVATVIEVIDSVYIPWLTRPQQKRQTHTASLTMTAGIDLHNLSSTSVTELCG